MKERLNAFQKFAKERDWFLILRKIVISRNRAKQEKERKTLQNANRFAKTEEKLGLPVNKGNPHFGVK